MAYHPLPAGPSDRKFHDSLVARGDKDSMSRFLVFEGLDGSGKSSLMQVVEKELAMRGLNFHRTREPGGSALGRHVRPLILDKDGPRPVPRAELLLYEADRAQHVDEIIRPKLAAGVWVLSDRHAASSIAFQAGGRAIAEADVRWLNDFATAGLRPDLTFLMDLSVEQAKGRRAGRTSEGGQGEDRIEAEADAFHERVRQSFLEQARAEPDRWLVLPAERSPAEIVTLAMAELRRRGWLA